MIFDIETDGLNPTKIHCVVINGEVFTDIDKAVEMLGFAKEIIGHNIIGFDIPALQKFYPYFQPKKVIDTLVLSRLIFPDMIDRDVVLKDFPSKLIGRHSLEAWGHRLHLHKGDYSGDWQECTQEMLDYCVQDVAVTTKLYEKLKAEGFSEESINLEHAVAHIIHEQTKTGFAFNTYKAQGLVSELSDRREKLKKLLSVVFPAWEIRTPFIPKVNNKTRGYVKGVEIDKVKVIEFNPGSRDHVANRLIAKRNWRPKQFTPDGKPKVDEKVLSGLEYPEAKLLSEYYMLQKRLGQISEGAQAWLRHEKNGRIHGQVNTNGAVTGRATHFNPNVTQTPENNKPYGKEFRSLFIPSKGRKLVGIDVSGLELRCLAHYMFPYDNGKYAKEVVSGDIHTVNQKAAGLSSRAQAKTFIYALIFGAGNLRMGQVIGKGAQAGALIKRKFFNEIPALNKLMTAVKRGSAKGFLYGLDKRKIKIRSSHSALNALLQSCGAIICKQFLIEFNKSLLKNKLVHKANQVAWVHDEIQVEADEDVAELVGKLAVEAIEKSGTHFKFRCPLTGEYNIGSSWAETH